MDSSAESNREQASVEPTSGGGGGGGGGGGAEGTDDREEQLSALRENIARKVQQ